MGRTLQLQTPRVLLPMCRIGTPEHPVRYRGLFGGRGGLKSHFFAERLVEDHLAEPGLRSVCIREVQKSLEQSVKRLIEDKLIKFDLGEKNGFRVLDTQIITPGDGVIIFQGMQNHTKDSIKSLERFKRAWIEEAQSLSAGSLEMLRPTIREDGSEIWASWNPAKPTDPIDDFFRGNAPRKPTDAPWAKPDDAIVLQTSYQDNPWFPDVLRKEMEWDKARDVDKYANIWRGQYESRSEARVFKNWRVGKPEEFQPPSGTGFLLGADWGFSVDPSTMFRGWLRDAKTLMIDYEVYRIGVEIDDLPRFFDGLVCGCDYLSPRPCANPPMHAFARGQVTVADSARPETISYLRRNGYSAMEPAIKGANSVKEGVIFLQGYDIIIHPRCEHAIEEFTDYSYVVDAQTQLVTSQLADKKNHVIDPVRYATERLRGGKVRVRRANYGGH